MTQIIIAAVEGAVNNPEFVTILLQYGGLGVMLLWFMIRVEKRMDAQIKSDLRKVAALDRNSHSLMTTVLALKNLDSNISELAHRVLDEIEEAGQHHEDENTRD